MSTSTRAPLPQARNPNANEDLLRQIAIADFCTLTVDQVFTDAGQEPAVYSNAKDFFKSTLQSKDVDKRSSEGMQLPLLNSVFPVLVQSARTHRGT